MQIWQNFLSQAEVQSVVSIVSKLKKNAHLIHGEKRRMLKLIKGVESLKLDFQKKSKTFSTSEEIDFSKLIDCSIIWTEKNATPQVWHMDAIERFAVLNIILTTDIPTEFLNIPKQNDEKFEYPLNWNLHSSIFPIKIKSGDGIFFWSNEIHRGPANGEEERISLYLTFPLFRSSSSPTTDFAYPNWAWIDSKFNKSTTLKRTYNQIDFILKNNLLCLYPIDWHGSNVYQSVENQIDERKSFIASFPPLNLFLVEYEDIFYLANIKLKQTIVEICYYPTCTFNSNYIEKIDLHSWELIKKIRIDVSNLDLYQGYSLKPKENYIQKKVHTVYLFSHLALKECDIVIPKIVNANVFVHPLLVFE